MIPLGDRQVAMSLLLELALQRGTLNHILDALLLLLRLLDMPYSTADKNKCCHKSKKEEGKEQFQVQGGQRPESGEMSFPLVPFLRRLNSIPTPLSPYQSPKREKEVKVNEHGHTCHVTIIYSFPLA